jgi:hypothetical protein
MKQPVLFSCLLLAGLGLLRSSLPVQAAAATPLVRYQTIARATNDGRALLVYPNPNSTGMVNLTISGFENRRVEVSVLNVIGTVMYRETLTELTERSTKTLDLRDLANGLYYVKVEADNTSQLCKLIIR